MSKNFKLTLTLLLILGIAGIAYRSAFFRPKTPPSSPTPSVTRDLSMLASRPDWSVLEPFQNTISGEDFERLISTVFTTGEKWKNFIEITTSEARIKTGSEASNEIFHLRFSPSTATTPAPRHWKTAAELPASTLAKPLAGIRIAIDPGHIGGEWAKMEERWFVLGSGKPVCEGDMTLQVAYLLKPRLEALGATASLVREKNAPVTPLRPASLLALAEASTTPEAREKYAERLFYRTAEIRARADLVNQIIKPDLVLCLHFNAEGWGNPNNPILTDHNHLHFLVNGAYDDDEIALADQRFALLHKLLQRSQEEEIAISTSLAKSFVTITGLPPYQYPPQSTNVRPIQGNPYLWARNLLANRLYDCPVIFMEPYVMNSTTAYARIQAGDYEGLREIAGTMRPSIFREYADAVATGLSHHYAALRKP